MYGSTRFRSFRTGSNVMMYIHFILYIYLYLYLLYLYVYIDGFGNIGTLGHNSMLDALYIQCTRRFHERLALKIISP